MDLIFSKKDKSDVISNRRVSNIRFENYWVDQLPLNYRASESNDWEI